MAQSLTNQSREVLALANEEARHLQHGYVGTEHILLALVRDQSSDASKTLATFGINAERVYAEVEKLIERGPNPVAMRTLPLTPRAQRAIDQAGIEAASFNEKCASPEHLLLGLLGEEHGVACEVLLNLGLTPEELRKEVFRTRLAMMKIVERAVRPLRASTAAKRKIREELLAHLTAIYHEELAQLNDPAAALETASRRFGEPAALSDELQTALPGHERLSHFAERWFAWRAPESVSHYAIRQSTVTFCILAVVFSLVIAGVFLRYGSFDSIWVLIRTLAAITLVTPPTQFIITVCTIKMRDSLLGAFGSPKSLIRALLYDVTIGLIVAVSMTAFAVAARWNLDVEDEALKVSIVAGFIAAIASFIHVRLSGPNTVRDTQWALLDIESA